MVQLQMWSDWSGTHGGALAYNPHHVKPSQHAQHAHTASPPSAPPPAPACTLKHKMCHSVQPRTCSCTAGWEPRARTTCIASPTSTSVATSPSAAVGSGPSCRHGEAAASNGSGVCARWGEQGGPGGAARRSSQPSMLPGVLTHIRACKRPLRASSPLSFPSHIDRIVTRIASRISGRGYYTAGKWRLPTHMCHAHAARIVPRTAPRHDTAGARGPPVLSRQALSTSTPQLRPGSRPTRRTAAGSKRQVLPAGLHGTSVEHHPPAAQSRSAAAQPRGCTAAPPGV